MGVETAGIGSSFRVFHTRLRDAFAEFHGPFVSIDVLLAWGTMRFTSVVVHHAARSHGRSSYSPARLLSHCFDVITGFSTLPLRLASWTGFFFTVFGIVVLIYVVGAFLILGYSVPGFPFLASIIAIFAGAQLFALGIIGEYIARMHFRLMDRPTYVVRQTAERQERETSNTEHPTPNAAPPAATSGPAGGRTLPPDSE
jgi:undecaprenyl-phosphate 4-deoxy-4-formamido-L-arabinose transferase